MCMCQYLLGSRLRLTDRTVAASADGRSSPSAAQWFGKTTSPATAGPRFAGHARAMRSKCNVRVCQRVHSRTSLPMEPEPDAMVPSQPHPAGLVLSPSRKTLARRSATIDNGQHFGSALSMPYARHGLRPLSFPFPVPFRALAHSTASKDQSSPRSGSVDDYSLRGTTARLTFDSCTFAAADRRRRSSRHLTLHTSWWL